MKIIDQPFVKTNKQHQLYNSAAELAEIFQTRAEYYDEHASFPFENFEMLKKKGYLSLTIPKEYGGDEISLYEFLLLQEKIAQGDAATALCLGWHLGILMNLRDTKKWSEETFERVCKEIFTDKKLLNSAATEPNSGSPARGGKPETTASLKDEKWVINGKKIFTSLAPALDYFIIPATISETGEIGDFLVPRYSDGISIQPTWNTLGMRATRSDDLILNSVEVDKAALVEIKPSLKKPPVQGWLLHIPACYMGVAIAARNDAITFAKTYQPTSLTHPISEVPEVRRKIAEIDLKLMTARTLMYHTAERWDQTREQRDNLGAELATVKTVVTNTAVEVVDLAMRIVGGQSLFKSNAMQRYYRDVRAGLHNPPSDDTTFKILSDRALSEY
ncbi:acyl-CoA dehydrogenase family protein [Metabacillus herbersteinensis]|uniref:Acyl-CoA dehydrogenase family protein n=1 Tax=Metabacillus herbersteinensis TaxID=283816 RepID=A0ABV6GB63_9BACI